MTTKQLLEKIGKVNEKISKYYYIDRIDELKNYINHIKTYKSPQDKPVYNIKNAFTPPLLNSL